MNNVAKNSDPVGRKPVPRGIARTGPALLFYGFRPFFLGAGVFAIVSMTLWIGALTAGWQIAGEYGALNWHAHEMLFGYASAALAGFMLTAIPNWTGRLPVSGLPLLGLVALWLVGRLVMLAPHLLGLQVSLLIEGAFLPILAVIAGREIVTGKNWKNLKILTGLVALAAANAAFHLSVAFTSSGLNISRYAVAILVLLIGVVGGRIIPSFTRNWLVKAGATRVPAPFGPADIVALVALLLALLAWALAPDAPATAAMALLAAALHTVRLWRWHGWLTLEEPLLVALHTAYAFIPIGLLGVSLASLDIIAQAAALHLLTVGVIGNMTLAVMTRATLGHTGRPLTASRRTAFGYLALLISTVTRPFAEIIPNQYHLLLSLSATAWLVAFGLFVLEYGPMLCSRTAERGTTRS